MPRACSDIGGRCPLAPRKRFVWPPSTWTQTINGTYRFAQQGGAMRIFIGTLILLGVVKPLGAYGQESMPRRAVGVYGGADISTISEPGDYRVGIRYVARWFGRVELYPAVEIIVNGRSESWQALAALRIRPFGWTGMQSFWYVGAGAIVRSSEVRKAVLTGIEIPLKNVQAFTELRFHGPIEHADGRLELLVGLGFGIH